MVDSKYTVKLHLYDLSQGMARQFSQGFIGKQIDGIWHTGIVVYGREYFFGGGICEDTPGQTPFGIPTKIIDLGQTEIPQEVFLDFLKDISPKFTFNTYDLFTNNCNNFTDECAQFLVGEGIPSYITGLPGEFLNTPLGKMMQPFITQMTQSITGNTHVLFNTNPQATNTTTNTTTTTAQTQGESPVKNVTSIEEFFGLLEEYPAALVAFSSIMCGPCRAIQPAFEKLAREYATKRPEIKFIKVPIDQAPDIKMNFSVFSVPTFIGFVDGLQAEKFVGANELKLRQLASFLETKLEAAGKLSKVEQPKGEQFDFEYFNPSKPEPLVFTSDNLSLPISKIQELVEKDKVLSESSMKDAFNIFAKDPKQLMKSFTKEQKTYLMTWLCETLLYFGLTDKVMPFLDLLRILCADPSFAEVVVEGPQAENLAKIFQSISKGENEMLELPKPLRLVLLRFMANVAGSKKGAKWLEVNLEKQAKNTIDNSFKFLLNEPAAITATMYLMINLIQNIGESEKIQIEAGTWLEHLSIVLSKEEDEKTLSTVVTSLCWLSYRVKGIRPKVSQLSEILKVEKLKTAAKDVNLAKQCRDLSKIISKP